MSTPNSCRLAMPAEATDLARLQRRAWSRDPRMAAALEGLGADDMARSWHEAIVKPPLAHFRVLVAIDDSMNVTGFAAIGPSPDDDATQATSMVAEFIVDATAEQEEHKSRLMHAVVDTMRKDGYETATMWLATDADEDRAFLTECGWGPDGAHREVGTDEVSVKQVRMHTDIRPD